MGANVSSDVPDLWASLPSELRRLVRSHTGLVGRARLRGVSRLCYREDVACTKPQWFVSFGDELFRVGLTRIVCELDSIGVLDLMIQGRLFVSNVRGRVVAKAKHWSFVITDGESTRITATPMYRPMGPTWLSDLFGVPSKNRAELGFQLAIPYSLDSIRWSITNFDKWSELSESISGMKELLGPRHGWVRRLFTPVALSILSQSPA